MRSSADAGGCFPTGRHYPCIAHLIRAAARGTAEEWSPDLPVADLPWVSLDVEATGLEPGVDRVVEIACVVFERGDAARGEPALRVERHSWLVNPGRPIPAEAQAVHQRPAFEVGVQFARAEGILPAPEPTHAIRVAVDEALAAKEAGESRVILFNLCGHGHFDLAAYERYLDGTLEDYEYPREKVEAALAGLPAVG